MGMQRNNEMLKDLLVQFRDELDPGQSEVRPDSVKENYHIYLLLNAKFIEANEISQFGEELPFYDNLKVTTAGHDFLDAAKNNIVWNNAKKLLKEKGLEITTIPLDVLLITLKQQMSNLLGFD